MMAPRLSGLSGCQSRDASLVTVMKSEPRNTAVTPAMPNRRCASGERPASAALVKVAVPWGMTARPGRNLRVAGLGVVSVWMNIVEPWLEPLGYWDQVGPIRPGNQGDEFAGQAGPGRFCRGKPSADPPRIEPLSGSIRGGEDARLSAKP